jgi:hypothetical protein
LHASEQNFASVRFGSNGLPQPWQLRLARRDPRLRRAAALRVAASHSVEQQNSFGGCLLRLAMIGRPQWMHGDCGDHSLMSGKPGKHAAQTRMMQPGHFRLTQGWL